MLFHWYLFVFLFILYAVAKIGNQKYPVYVAGEYEGRYRHFTALTIVAVLTYVAASRYERFIDTGTYIQLFLNSGSDWDAIRTVLNGNDKDKGFGVAVVILKALLGERYRVYLAVVAGFCLLCVFYVYRKHSSNLFVTTFLFIASGEYVMWTHNGMRQFIAVSMVFAATDLLLRKKYIPYIAIVLFASTFHASALIVLPTILVVQGKPWNFKAILMLLAIMVLVSSSDTLNSLLIGIMENSQYSNDIETLMGTEGANAFRVLVFSIPPLMALFFRQRLSRLNVPIINLAINMSIVSMGIYIIAMFTSGIYIARLPIYFSLYNYILLPWIIDRFYEKNSAKLIHLCVIACYMAYYYYQMHIVWGDVTSK